MRNLKRIFAAALISAFTVGTADAATVNIQSEDGDAAVTQHGIGESTSTNGGHIGGMILNAVYTDGSSEDLIWNALSGYGTAVGSGLSMFFSWDSFELTTTKRLKSLSMDAGIANAVFDIAFLSELDEGNTPGTSYGFGYRTSGGDELSGEIDVTYSGIVTRQGYETGVDLYTDMYIDYTGLEGGGLLGTTFFQSDLDSLAVAGDLVSSVPLPAGLPLLLGGLGLFGILRRKRG